MEVEEVGGGRERGRELDPRCAEESGFSLHADVWIDALDRKRLERLCRYVLRPAVASERLREREDGRIEYGLRRPWRDGTTGFAFEPIELVERLAALVPAPGGHLVRYHGVLGPAARWRCQVVRDRSEGTEPASGANPESASGSRAAPERAVQPVELRERRLSWAELMARVYAADVLECPRCRGRRRVIAVITDAVVIVGFLTSLGLPTRAPPRGRAVEEEESAGWGRGEPDPVDE